ncbi:unnamed protein product [Onchocerca flexuosa]|uniref:Uncharacterized protein n=1 Tax=Onchocerca flexuosa TaxID=387005 RepID=A0A183HUS4_9BILA|nr:unnamed protein product [Onchocerca flexuosa]
MHPPLKKSNNSIKKSPEKRKTNSAALSDRPHKLPVVIVCEQDKISEDQNFTKASTSKHLTSTEIKEKADHLLNAVFKHKNYKTAIQKQAIYAVARSEFFFSFK